MITLLYPVYRAHIKRVSQGFNPPKHYGIDFACAEGTPLYAPIAGHIFSEEQDTGFGKYVRIENKDDHGRPVFVYLAHMSKHALPSGVWVEQGALVGWSGNTGNSTGPHVHVEVRLGGRAQACAIDPAPLFLSSDRASVLCPFYQSKPEPGAPSVDVIINSRVPAVRALHIHEMDFNPFPDKEVHARIYTVGDEAEMALALEGRDGARRYVEILRPAWERLKALGIKHVSGINEPHPQNDDQMRALTAFQIAVAEEAAAQGFCYWCFDWGVGWPQWGTARLWVDAVRVARETGGGLCVHLYGAPDVFENDRFGIPDEHYALRVVGQIRELYDAGLPTGDRWIVIGECGIDGGVIPWWQDPWRGQQRRRGWKQWSGWAYPTPEGPREMTAGYYWQRLSAYDDVLKEIPEIRFAFPFVAHPFPEWSDFAIEQYHLNAMAEKHSHIITTTRVEVPRPGEDIYINEAVQRGDIGLLLNKMRWWQEEAVRRLDAGDYAIAHAIMNDLIALSYIVESEVKHA